MVRYDALSVMLLTYAQGLEGDPEIRRFEEDEVAVVSLHVHDILQRMRQLAEIVEQDPIAVRKWLRQEWQSVTGASVAKMEQLLFSVEEEEDEG